MTTVLSRGRSCRIDSPNVAPTPKLQSVTGLCWIHANTHTYDEQQTGRIDDRSNGTIPSKHPLRINICGKNEKEREKKVNGINKMKKKMDNRTNKTQQNNRKLVSSFPFDVQSIRRCIAIVTSAWRRCRVGFNINWCWDERYRKIDWHQVNRTHMSHDERREKERESGWFGGRRMTKWLYEEREVLMFNYSMNSHWTFANAHINCVILFHFNGTDTETRTHYTAHSCFYHWDRHLFFLFSPSSLFHFNRTVWQCLLRILWSFVCADVHERCTEKVGKW